MSDLIAKLSRSSVGVGILSWFIVLSSSFTTVESTRYFSCCQGSIVDDNDEFLMSNPRVNVELRIQNSSFVIESSFVQFDIRHFNTMTPLIDTAELQQYAVIQPLLHQPNPQ